MSKGLRDTKTTSLIAQSDLSSGKQGLFVKISTDLGCDLAGAGGDAIGTLLDGSKGINQPASVAIGPIVPVVLNATLSAGAEVMSDASNKAVAWVTANRSLGYLLEGGVAGDTVSMLLVQNGRKA